MTTYEELLINNLTYEILIENNPSYAAVIQSPPVVTGGYGEYALQVMKYQPISYWQVSTSSTENPETPIYGVQALLSKSSVYDGYKSIVSTVSPGHPILFSGDTISMSSGEFSKLKIASSVYNKQEFTINFWMKILNDNVNSTDPIFNIGNGINLYTKNGMLFLDFLGQKTYADVISYKEPLNVSISFNGTDSALIVNGIAGNRISDITGSFEASPSTTWTARLNDEVVIQSIAAFGYAVSVRQATYLYEVGTQPMSNLKTGFDLIDGYTLDYSVPEINRTVDAVINTENIILRNCSFENNQFFMIPKQKAIINGAIFNSSGYAFSTNASITIPVTEKDIDIRNCSVIIQTSPYNKSGTIFSIQGSKYLKLKVVSNNYELYSSDSETPIFTSPVLESDTGIAVNFVDGNITVSLNGLESTTGVLAPATIAKIVLGNEDNLSSGYDGIVSAFSINYHSNPLQIGIYKLDLSQEYSERITPKSDSVAVFQAYLPASTTGNYITFKSSGGTEVMMFDETNTVAEYFSCTNGTPLSDGDSLSAVPLVEDTPLLLAIRLTSDTTVDFSLPKITDLKLYGYSNSSLQLFEVDAETSSISSYPYDAYGDKIFARDTFSITNTSYQISAIFMRINAKVIPASKNIVTIGTTSIAITKIDDLSYTLSSSAGSLTVNGGSGQTLYVNDDVYVVLDLGTPVNMDILFDMDGIYLSDLAITADTGWYYDFFVEKFSEYSSKNNVKVVLETDTIPITDSVIVKAFTSNIVLSS